ncbi:MAG: hypothetical protein JOZ87_04480 [Chloroflexi bacterium]|nr:hypothetical protein [Chloroflexota bacterium]
MRANVGWRSARLTEKRGGVPEKSPKSVGVLARFSVACNWSAVAVTLGVLNSAISAPSLRCTTLSKPLVLPNVTTLATSPFRLATSSSMRLPVCDVSLLMEIVHNSQAGQSGARDSPIGSARAPSHARLLLLEQMMADG